MVFEFILASIKSIFAFFLLCLFCFLLLFKINTYLYRFYFFRNNTINTDVEKSFYNIKKIYKPVFSKLSYKVEPLSVTANVFIGKNIEFKYYDNKIKITKKQEGLNTFF